MLETQQTRSLRVAMLQTCKLVQRQVGCVSGIEACKMARKPMRETLVASSKPKPCATLFIILDLIIVGLKSFELMILDIRDSQVILMNRVKDPGESGFIHLRSCTSKLPK